LASSDFTSGKLAVVVTADEDDSTSGNKVLTVVLHASLDGSHKVVSTALTHYSLSRFYSQTTGGSPLRKAAAAPDMAEAFGLTVRPITP
jgi:phosphatidylinositol-3-phosphatase